MCSRAVPIVATHDIAMQTLSSSTSKPSTCTASTQTISLPSVPAHTTKTSVIPSNKQEPCKLNWADDVNEVLPTLVSHLPPPPRDLSILSTGVMRPFGTLQHCVNRSRSYLRQPRRHHHFTQPPSYTQATPIVTWGPTITHHHPSGISSGKPVFTLPSSVLGRVQTSTIHLDWDQDPWLINLSDALRSLGWVRPMGYRALSATRTLP
jgi:hypothetical protein